MSEAAGATAHGIDPHMSSNVCRIGERTFTVRDIQSDDAPQVLKLYNAVFGHRADAHWYRWKSCHGQLRAVGLWDEAGELVAHYAGLPRPLVRESRPMAALQICDVMVAPQVRGLMTRRGPFFQVCSQFFRTWVGAGRSYEAAFGFPNLRHMQLGERLDLYYNGAGILLLKWMARRHPLSWRWRWSALPTDTHSRDRELQGAWQAMQKDCKEFVLGVRDAEYLRWRFLERPDRQYRVFCLRHWWGGTAAVVVLHVTPDSAELLDVIGPRHVMPLAVQAAVNEAERSGLAELTAWASLAAASVLGVDAQRTESGAILAVAKASRLAAEEVASARWWWLGGDTDFR
jgi:hypothetical protein